MIRVLGAGVLSLALFVASLGPVAGRERAVHAAATLDASAQASVVSALPEAEEGPQQNPYSYPSQCTYRAWDLAAQAGHRLPKFGDAADWRQGAIDAGYRVRDTLGPDCVGSVAVWRAGAGGASWAGHVAWVTAVDGNRFHVQERNWQPGRDGERWVTWVKGISFITFEEPDPTQLHVVEALTLSPAAPVVGEEVRARFRVRNVGPRPITLQDVAAGARRGSDWGGEWADFPAASNITLLPGQEYGYERALVFSEPGAYFAAPIVRVGDRWSTLNGGKRCDFTVRERALLPLALAGSPPVIGPSLLPPFQIDGLGAAQLRSPLADLAG